MDTSREFEVYAFQGAGIYTAAATDAFLSGKSDLCVWVLSLRAVAEDTPKGTSLEEDYAADAGAVLKATSLNINDEGELTQHRACGQGPWP